MVENGDMTIDDLEEILNHVHIAYGGRFDKDSLNNHFTQMRSFEKIKN